MYFKRGILKIKKWSHGLYEALSIFGRNVTAEEASVVRAPSAVLVKAVSGKPQNIDVGPQRGLRLGWNQVAIFALGAVAVGLGELSKLKVEHDSFVMVDG